MLAEQMNAAIGKENVFLELIENMGYVAPAFFTLKNVHNVLD